MQKLKKFEISNKKNISLNNVINSLNNKINQNKEKNSFFQKIKISTIYYGIPLIIIILQCTFIWLLSTQLTYYNLERKKKSLIESQNVICLDIYRGLNYQNLEFNNYPIKFKNPNFISGNKQRGPQNYDLKLCDFYISSSRKTYLACGNCDGSCSYDAIKYALLKGARLINIDVYDEIIFGKKIPVIMNSNSDINKKQYLDFITTLNIIKNTAWKINPSYPLIIYFEFFNNNNKDITLGFGNKDKKKLEESINIYNMVANSLKKIFGFGDNFKEDIYNNKIIGRNYGFGGKNNTSQINLAPIKYLKGKIIFYSNYYPTFSSLDELIHGQVSIPDIKCPEFIIPSSNLSQLTYCNSLDTAGGIAGLSVQRNKVVNHQKLNQTLVVSSDISCAKNKSWMDKLYNPILADCFSYGMQCVLIYFQYCDVNNKLAFNFFRKSSFIVKEINLRYIPPIEPPPPITQKTSNNFASRNVWDVTGFQNLTI